MTSIPVLCVALAAGSFLAVPSPASQEHPLAPESRNVAIVVYPGVELLDFSGPGEVFSASMGSAGHDFRVYTVASSAAPVVSQGFVTVTPGYTIADCPEPDIVVVPGGSVPMDDEGLIAWLGERSDSAEILMSVCNGAHLLGAAGLLEGLEVTSHHGALRSLAARNPSATVLSNRRFVDSGHVVTCAGVSAGIDGALQVVTRLHGEGRARAIARYMEYDWRPDEIAAQHAEAGVRVSVKD
jgi:transcriptional regulator GlxA family with amidase domain